MGKFNLSEWTDRHLAGAAFRSDVGDQERNGFIDSKSSIDLDVLTQLEDEISAASSGSWLQNAASAVLRQQQVAFLFMTMDGLEFEDIWDNFFEDAPSGAYSIFVHRAASDGGGEGSGLRSRRTQPLALARWGAVDVPRVETSWCALMGGEVALLTAALQDSRNQQFVFVSQSTIPLKNFAYVYHQLMEVSPTTSKFCFAEPASSKFSATETVRNELKRQCIFRDFYRALNPRILKHHQWVVLAREHAQIVTARAREALLLWREAWVEAAPDVAGMGEGCSDEAVPAAALLHDLRQTGRSTGNTWGDLVRMGVEQTCLTYVFWRHCYGGTELEIAEPITRELRTLVEHGDIRMLTDKDFNFYRSALKRELNGYPAVFGRVEMDYLMKLVHSSFMFARKFAPGLLVETGSGAFRLEEILPKLWAHVDEEASSQRTWSRLEAAGAPRSI